MYLMGVKPWESATWVVPPIEQMSGKVREKLEEANPELRVVGSEGVHDEGLNERRGSDMGVHGEDEVKEDMVRDGSEEGLRGKKEIEP
jgi:hypothetical protein